MAETASHHALKRLAAAFLLEEGHAAVGLEVRCPGSRYRADVAGYLDRLARPRENGSGGASGQGGGAALWSTAPVSRRRHDRRCEPRTVLIECKQSRGDFIRDDRRAEELIRLRDEAESWRTHLEETRIKAQEPELRRSGTSLFPDLETWDFAGSRLASYRKLLRRIRSLEKQLHGETKFCLMARYRLADFLYLAVPRGLVERREVPPGWGLIEFPRGLLSADTLDEGSRDAASVALPAPHHDATPENRRRLLRNIAVAATRESLRRGPAAVAADGLPRDA